MAYGSGVHVGEYGDVCASVVAVYVPGYCDGAAGFVCAFGPGVGCAGGECDGALGVGCAAVPWRAVYDGLGVEVVYDYAYLQRGVVVSPYVGVSVDV